MASEPNLALRRSKRTGWTICIVAAALAVLFLWGLGGQSYWAVAVPVAVGVMAVLWLAFWTGWTIRTIDTIPPEAEPYESRFARRAGAAISVASVALGLLFLAGLWARSYWALAIPVAVAVLGLLAMVFQIGWAIVTQRTTLPRAEEEPAGVSPPEPPEGLSGRPAAERPAAVPAGTGGGPRPAGS